jgi:hypothetical protein
MEPTNGNVYTASGGGGSGTLTANANYGNADIFLGYGGCWVYIIGKKHLK